MFLRLKPIDRMCKTGCQHVFTAESYCGSTALRHTKLTVTSKCITQEFCSCIISIIVSVIPTCFCMKLLTWLIVKMKKITSGKCKKYVVFSAFDTHHV